LHPSANDISKCTASAIAKFFKMLTARFFEGHPFCEFAKFVKYDAAGGARNFAKTGFDCPSEITCPQVIAQAFEIAHSKS
jgi:hypothetical protein